MKGGGMDVSSPGKRMRSRAVHIGGVEEEWSRVARFRRVTTDLIPVIGKITAGPSTPA